LQYATVEMRGECEGVDAMRELLPDDWRQALEGELGSVNEQRLDCLIQQTRTDRAYPPTDKIFQALALTGVTQIQAVILGQDPYPKEGEACGLAFDFAGDGPPPHSLSCILAELRRDKDAIGDWPIGREVRLRPWADRGVLLLNAALTVEPGKAGSHLEVWRPFTDAVLQVLAGRPKVVFLFWGRAACEKAWELRLGPDRVVLSGHTAGRGKTANVEAAGSLPPFKGSHPFSSANAKLRALGAHEIDWRL
jgi:uracil-DNA glycosylase